MEVFKIIVLALSLLTIPYHSHAEEQPQVFGDWKASVFLYNEVLFSYANTTNDSDSTLGVLCIRDSSSCLPYLVNSLSCEVDGKYPALVSVDDGLESVTMECLVVGDRFLFMLPIDHLPYIITNNKYGVAFGVEGGKFKAAYFSLSGSAKALIAAKNILDAAQPIDKNNDNKDTML